MNFQLLVGGKSRRSELILGATNLSSVSGGCIGSYVSVASLPAHLRITASNGSVRV